MADGSSTFRPLGPAPAKSASGVRRDREGPLPPDVERLDRIATFLDSKFGVPGFRFGFDSILGLIPGIGDFAAFGISGYIILEASKAGASRKTLARMTANAGIDALIGTVPLVGDVFDVFFKANKRNIRLLRRELLKKHDERLAREPLTVKGR